MSSPQSRAKARGTLFERQVAELLDASGVFAHPVNRAPRWGSKDKGDLVGTHPFCFELKATKHIDLAGFITEAEAEAANAEARWPVVVVKRRRKSVDQAYAVMTLETLIELIGEGELALAGKVEV